MHAVKTCSGPSHESGRYSERHCNAGPTKLHVNPIFEIGPLEPRFSEWLVFEVRSLAGLWLQC